MAEVLLLTPSRSQMIVFAAWGPDPTSADPVTGTTDPASFILTEGEMKLHAMTKDFAVLSRSFLILSLTASLKYSF